MQWYNIGKVLMWKSVIEIVSLNRSPSDRPFTHLSTDRQTDDRSLNAGKGRRSGLFIPAAVSQGLLASARIHRRCASGSGIEGEEGL